MNFINLHEITALSFEKYMLLQGWKRDYKFKNKKLMVFESGNTRIAIPGSEKYSDFYNKIEDIIYTLEMYLDKDADEIIKEIITSYYDRLEFRIRSDFSKKGKLPLGYAADCIDGLRELILYSSCAEQNAQPVCLRATSSSRRLMNKFELAQTEIGSFIINIDTEVVEDGQEQHTLDIADIPVPMEHRVVQRIFTAITQVNDVVERRNDVGNIINNAFKNGITANMCDALLKLKADEVEIDATVRYASAITQKPGVSNKVVLKSNHFYVIDEISRRYKEVVRFEDVVLRGLVGEMKKDRMHVGNEQAIVLVTVYDDKLRKIQVELSNEDYEIANHAHMNDLEIEISGELDMTNPRKWVLNGPFNLKIVYN